MHLNKTFWSTFRDSSFDITASLSWTVYQKARKQTNNKTKQKKENINQVQNSPAQLGAGEFFVKNTATKKLIQPKKQPEFLYYSVTNLEQS